MGLTVSKIYKRVEMFENIALLMFDKPVPGVFSEWFPWPVEQTHDWLPNETLKSRKALKDVDACS